MAGAWDILGSYGDTLLRSRCSWEVRTGFLTDAQGNKLDTYAAAVSLACNVNAPSRRWESRWPLEEITGAKEFYFPHNATVAVRDRLTFDSLRYLVIDLNDWDGAGYIVLAQRHEGLT